MKTVASHRSMDAGREGCYGVRDIDPVKQSSQALEHQNASLNANGNSPLGFTHLPASQLRGHNVRKKRNSLWSGCTQ